MPRVLVVAVVLFIGMASCSTSTPTPPPTPTSATVAPTTVPSSTAAADTTEPGGIDPQVVDALRKEVEELAGIAEAIRGLPFLDEPDVVFLTESELAARVLADFQSELEPGELEWTGAWLDLLGLFDQSEQTLLDIYNALLGEQVVGLYLPETGELLVRGDTDDLSALSRTTVIHELIHALTDQHFGIGDRLEDLIEGDRFDEATAYLSFLEGEATFFQLTYVAEYLSPAEALALATEALAADTSALDDTPYAIAESLFFRYEDGLNFVIALADQGIEAFNEVHRDPPTSTEQIAHYSRFALGENPLPVAPVEVIVPGYSVVESSTWGELGLLTTFGQAIGEGAAAQIGDGWGGDVYQVLTSGDDVIFALSYVGDSEADAAEVFNAFETLATESMDAGEAAIGDDGSLTFTGEDFAFVDRQGSAVVFVAASDPVAGAAAATAVDIP